MAQGDIVGPTVLLTGPTSGLGAHMLRDLVSRASRPSLVLLARDPLALERAVAGVRARGLAACGIRIDLSDLRSVRSACEEITARQLDGALGAIDVALLNAGAQFATARRTGAQGHELTFTVNVIAQHLLLRGLEPLLAPSAHVVVMGSSTHRGRRASFYLVPDPEWREPDALAAPDASAPDPGQDRRRGGVAYGTSKPALLTLSHDWAQRLAGAGRRLNTYDPGLVPGTGLGRDLPPPMYWVWKNVMPAMRVLPGASSPGNSARRAVQLALADIHPGLSDGYVEIGRVAQAEPVTFISERRKALWEWLEATVGDVVPAGA